MVTERDSSFGRQGYAMQWKLLGETEWQHGGSDDYWRGDFKG